MSFRPDLSEGMGSGEIFGLIQINVNFSGTKDLLRERSAEFSTPNGFAKSIPFGHERGLCSVEMTQMA